MRIQPVGSVAIGDTRIGSGTKCDNLVQTGHQVIIGCDCLLCGRSGTAGSAWFGDWVVVGLLRLVAQVAALAKALLEPSGD